MGDMIMYVHTNRQSTVQYMKCIQAAHGACDLVNARGLAHTPAHYSVDMYSPVSAVKMLLNKYPKQVLSMADKDVRSERNVLPAPSEYTMGSP